MEIKSMAIIMIMSIISGFIEAGPHSKRLQVFALAGSLSAFITFASFAVWLGHSIAVLPYFLVFYATNMLAFILGRIQGIRHKKHEDE